MRTDHKPHALQAFPVYSSAFLSETQLVLGGGGGASKSGIKNKLRLYNVGTDKSLELLHDFDLERGEDAPMSMTAHTKSNTVICGVNSTQEELEKGHNDNCRVFSVKDHKLSLVGTQGTLPTDDLDDYQKATALSPDGSLLAVAGSYDMTLLAYPSLMPVAQTIHTEKEIYDVTISDTNIVVITTSNLLVYALPIQPSTDQSKTSVSLELVKSLGLPASLADKPGCVYRSARFNPTNRAVLYTVVNSSSPRTRKAKTPQRLAFICKWDTVSWTANIARKVGDRNLTCFEISADGKFLAFGSSDLTIGFLDAATLNPLVNILKAHEFPPTTIAFNPTSTLLVSGSADNTLRIIRVPDSVANTSSWSLILLFVTIFILLLAVLVPKYLGSGNLPW